MAPFRGIYFLVGSLLKKGWLARGCLFGGVCCGLWACCGFPHNAPDGSTRRRRSSGRRRRPVRRRSESAGQAPGTPPLGGGGAAGSTFAAPLLRLQCSVYMNWNPQFFLEDKKTLIRNSSMRSIGTKLTAIFSSDGCRLLWPTGSRPPLPGGRSTFRSGCGSCRRGSGPRGRSSMMAGRRRGGGCWIGGGGGEG